jgi:hypothetical protein
VVRATLSCDTQESNIVLAGNRFAHVCFQGFNYIVTATIKPLRGRVALGASGRSVVSLEGGDALVAGSVSTGTKSFTTVIWRFDGRTKTKLRTYRSRAVLVGVDGGRLLVDRPTAVDVLTRDGALVSTLKRPHEGGAVMRDGRVATLAGRRLTVSGVDGGSVVTKTLSPLAHIDDLDGDLVLYSVDTALHLLRLTDGKDVVLRFKGQFGYVHARLWHGGLFYAYNQESGLPGHAGYVSAATVRTLLGS